MAAVDVEPDAAEGVISRVAPDDDLELVLSPVERAEEAAERAANVERELGAAADAVQGAYDRTYAATLAEIEGESSAPDEYPTRESVDMAAAEVLVEEAPAPVAPESLHVSGSASEMKWSGKKPGTTYLTIKAVKIEVPEGSFRKGERLSFQGEAVVVSEAAKDKLDKDTKTAVEAVQTHDAVVLDFELTGE